MNKKRATLAGGCFWGVEELIRKLPGVLDTQVGYTGGVLPNPTYRDVCTGLTGHAEAIDILFDEDQLSFKELLHFFFRIHDPTTINRQGNDKGTQYRSAIFFHDQSQEQEALAVIDEVNKLKRFEGPVVTEVEAFERFWGAEEDHQDYLQKYPTGYTCHYIRN
jgi:peptide-methionine (S)-S-oxide reductase